MQESIYNILYFIEGDTITETAICTHRRDGSDDEKSAWLQSNVTTDVVKANRVPLSQPITQDTFIALQRLGRHLEVFEPLFKAAGASKQPLFCITAIVDGVPRIDIVTDHSPLAASAMQSLDTPTLNAVKDWLTEYATDEGFDLPRLLNDDYFSAIRLLFNSAQYVSCMKLLVSFIDTISFIAYGDERSVFIRWLDTHANLSFLGITSEELWEMRNSLLHMSSLDSRKVLLNRVRRIGFCVAPRGTCSPPDRDVTYFNLIDLIEAIAAGISNWINHINSNRDEFVSFVERYDRILSDDRVTYVAKP